MSNTIDTTEEIVATYTVADFLAENVRVANKCASDPILDLLTMFGDSLENDFTRINMVRTIAFQALTSAESTVRKLNDCINAEFKKAPTETKVDNYSALANILNSAADHINSERNEGRTYEEKRDFWERSVQEAVNVLRVAIRLHDKLASQFENGRTFWQEHANREAYKRQNKEAQAEYNKARAPKIDPAERKRILLDGLSRFNK